MPPKDGNPFAALTDVGGDAGSPGTRDAKKKARAAEHRRSHATHRSTTPPCLPPGTPFFTLAVEGPSTAVALDADGAEIVSLHFDDFGDLTSDSFREYAAAAVAAVTAAASREAGAAAAANFVDLTLDDDSDGNSDGDNALYDALDVDNGGDWSYDGSASHYALHGGDENDGGSGGGPFDFDAEFAAALEEAAAAAEVNNEAADADLALAMALQEEEEAAAAAERARRAAGNAWGRPPPGPSFSSVMGPRIPLYGAANIREPAKSEFPALGASSSTAAAGQQRRVPLRVAMAASRAKGVRVVRTNTPASGHSSDGRGSYDEMPAAPAALPGLPSFVRADDQLAHPSDFLNSVGDEAVQARADALRWARENAERETPGGGGGLDSATVKRMMNISDGTRPDSGTSASTSHSHSEAAGAGGPAAAENEEPERELYCRKNIRKLVLDMIAAGWEPLWGRGGGHLVYQRLVPPTGHKQLLVLPCTPSDRRSIEATHARLQRMDREAAEVRRRAAEAEAATRSGG